MSKNLSYLIYYLNQPLIMHTYIYAYIYIYIYSKNVYTYVFTLIHKKKNVKFNN